MCGVERDLRRFRIERDEHVARLDRIADLAVYFADHAIARRRDTHNAAFDVDLAAGDCDERGRTVSAGCCWRRCARRFAARRKYEDRRGSERGNEVVETDHAMAPCAPFCTTSDKMRPSIILIMRSESAARRASWLTQTTVAPYTRATRCSASITFLPF